jgi:hypothetical protein
MNNVIKSIIDKNCSKEEKNKALDLLRDEIEMAKGILSGKYKHCPDCDDYYLAKSYLTESETIETQICVYRGIINSGENEYADGYVDIAYSIWPKGHKHEVSRDERRR